MTIHPLKCKDPVHCGFLITKNKCRSKDLELYFIPHCELEQFKLNPALPNSNIPEAIEIFQGSPAAESHEVLLHGLLMTPRKLSEKETNLQLRCQEALDAKQFVSDCCAVDVDKLKTVLGIVE